MIYQFNNYITEVFLDDQTTNAKLKQEMTHRGIEPLT